MNKQTFLDAFGHIADAPRGIHTLRKLILTLAVRGRLTTPLATDEPAAIHIAAVRSERERLLEAGELRRGKDKPHSSGVAAPYSLPTGWVWAPFRDTCINLDSKRVPLSASERGSRRGSYDYYGASGVIDAIDDYLFDKPLLLIGEDGANLLLRSTPVAFVARGKYWVNNHAHVLDSVDVASLEYLSIFINAISLDPYVTGTAQPKLNQTRLNQIPVAVPPLEEQKRIVRRVDELMSLCDELEEQRVARVVARSTLSASILHRVSEADQDDDLVAAVGTFVDSIGLHLAPGEGDLATLKRVRQAILDLAVRGRLTHRDPDDVHAAELLERITAERDRLVKAQEIRRPTALPPLEESEHAFDIPASWVWTRLGDVCQSRLGKMLDDQKNTGTPTPYLRNSNVQWGRFDLENVKRIRLEDAELSEYSLRDGDLLVVEGGEPGRCAIWDSTVADGVMVFQKALHRVRPEGDISPRFVALVLRNGVDSGRLRELFTGSTIKHLTGEKLKSFPIPVPPVEEQHRIVDSVDQLTSLCDDLEQQFCAARDTRRDLGASVVAHATPADESNSTP
ncbi:restriction endonuclease subunit S [Rhodococcus sp. ACT016]|uniref:restriction endonuclease subunit S n=1 Tax=Rhodococcus sp. ACT016 TaxID=3134808 RepID=UPI003D2878BB